MNIDNKLTEVEQSRWIALLLAIDEIDKHCDDRNINFETTQLNPIAIKHYINEMSPKILDELKKEELIENKKMDMQNIYSNVLNSVVQKVF